MKKVIACIMANFCALLAFSQSFNLEDEKVVSSQQPVSLTSYHSILIHQPNTTKRQFSLPQKAEGFENTGFAQFMASPGGRILRIAVGGGLIAWGATKGWSDGGAPLIIAGAVPASAGIFDFCVISPLAGGPFWGKKIRAAKGVLKGVNQFMDF